jgi:hypothetical protein
MTSNISLSELAERVEKLERAVFRTGKKHAKKDVVAGADHSGATGGIRLLVEDGFFDQRRNFAEVSTELQKRGYHYSRQAIQMPLTRLSKVGGPLVSLTGKGKNAYAKRK